jgi:hypothetical protein
VLYEEMTEQLSKSTPEKLETFRLNSRIFISYGDWDFKIKTKQGDFFIRSCQSVGNIDEVWNFIEGLCLGKNEVSWYCDQEGTDACLYAKAIDDTHVRFVLFSSGWRSFPDKIQLKNIDKKYYPPLQFDFIIKKDALISAFYAELLNGFSKGSKLEWNRGRYPDWTGKLNSQIVIEYFSKKNTVLQGDLYEFVNQPIEKLEESLKNGFNPNYLYVLKNNYGGQTPLMCLAIGGEDTFENRIEENIKLYNLFGKSYKSDKHETLQKIELFLSYGADPNFNSAVHIWDKTPLEIAIDSCASVEIIETLLKHGAKDTNLCWETAQKHLRYKHAYYKKVYELLKKYGEPTIYDDYEPKTLKAKIQSKWRMYKLQRLLKRDKRQ